MKDAETDVEDLLKRTTAVAGTSTIDLVMVVEVGTSLDPAELHTGKHTHTHTHTHTHVSKRKSKTVCLADEAEEAVGDDNLEEAAEEGVNVAGDDNLEEAAEEGVNNVAEGMWVYVCVCVCVCV